MSSRGRAALADVELLQPIPNPARILAIGVNYKSHAAETGQQRNESFPSVFLRMPSSVVAHGDPSCVRAFRRPRLRGRAGGRHRQGGALHQARGRARLHHGLLLLQRRLDPRLAAPQPRPDAGQELLPLRQLRALDRHAGLDAGLGPLHLQTRSTARSCRTPTPRS